MVPGHTWRIRGSTFKPFPAYPVVCFPCRLHTCVSLRVLPHLGTHSVKFSGDLFFLRDYLFCVLAFAVSCLYSLYKFSMVYSGYSKQQPMFDCDLSCSDWSRYVQELRNINSLTICSSGIHITYYSVWDFFLLRLSRSSSCCLNMESIHCSEVSL